MGRGLAAPSQEPHSRSRPGPSGLTFQPFGPQSSALRASSLAPQAQKPNFAHGRWEICRTNQNTAAAALRETARQHYRASSRSYYVQYDRLKTEPISIFMIVIWISVTTVEVIAQLFLLAGRYNVVMRHAATLACWCSSMLQFVLGGPTIAMQMSQSRVNVPPYRRSYHCIGTSQNDRPSFASETTLECNLLRLLTDLIDSFMHGHSLFAPIIGSRGNKQYPFALVLTALCTSKKLL